MSQNGVKMMCIECYFIFMPNLLENHWWLYVNPDATVNFESCSLAFLGELFFDNSSFIFKSATCTIWLADIFYFWPCFEKSKSEILFKPKPLLFLNGESQSSY